MRLPNDVTTAILDRWSDTSFPPEIAVLLRWWRRLFEIVYHFSFEDSGSRTRSDALQSCRHSNFTTKTSNEIEAKRTIVRMGGEVVVGVVELHLLRSDGQATQYIVTDSSIWEISRFSNKIIGYFMIANSDDAPVQSSIDDVVITGCTWYCF